MEASAMVLPNGVVTRADVGRLATEAEALDNMLNGAAIRGNGTELPKTSQLLDEMAAINKLNFLQPTDRQNLLAFLQHTRSSAPTIHMSFNTDPSPTFQQGLITWIRRELDPAILLHIGLHPNIGAGCVVRTTNKFFDFSLRQRFASQRQLLIEQLQGEAPAVAPQMTVEQITQPPIPAQPAPVAVEVPVPAEAIPAADQTPVASPVMPPPPPPTEASS